MLHWQQLAEAWVATVRFVISLLTIAGAVLGRMSRPLVVLVITAFCGSMIGPIAGPPSIITQSSGTEKP